MHHRIVSYALVLATTAAVLLITVIQPREAALRKKKLKDMRQFLVAQTCSPGGMYGEGGCAPLPLPPGGGYSGESSSGGSSGGGAESSSSGGSSGGENTVSGGGAENGISAKEKDRITTECLLHFAQSGYAETRRQYGWFTNILNSAVNSCKYAYLSTQGKFGASDLDLVADLLVKNAPPVGMLYQALEKTPPRKTGQSTGDYIDANKEGAAKYLEKCLEPNMRKFTEITSVTAGYLANPLPYVTTEAAATYNKTNRPAIESIEEKLDACLPAEPKKEGVAAVAEPIVKQKIVESIAQAKVASTPEETVALSLRELARIVLIKIKSLFSAIREMPPLHKAVSPKLGIQGERLQKTYLEKKVFGEKRYRRCIELGLNCPNRGE